ncbi:capsular associated protein [Armillaria gallica]|uniref:Capsular associated protein n=1 Tax=Armillaria gallica TaxID=47427 RepID=A0A2H3D2L9_ARMGA|nr:capsular associated protein [Armillaria gallica]
MRYTYRYRKHRRTLIATLLHYHPVLIACAAFSITTAIFFAYYLGYFSTFLVYLPFVTVCVPALAIFDAAHISDWSRWTSRRRRRFRLCFIWCLFLLLAPMYPSSSYLRNDASISPLPSNGTYYIAANLYNSAKVLPAWTKEMKLLIDHIGRQNVFVSIYESNSDDGTQEILRMFQKELDEQGVGNHMVVQEGIRDRWGLNSPGRISYMADIRNKVLEPLRVMGDQDGKIFTKVLFFNDVYFDWRAIVRLIRTKDGDYDLACALDFDGVGLYDIWVVRDACGRTAKEIWPYFSSDSRAVKSLRKGEPIEVASCWNGVAVFDATWFLAGSLPKLDRSNPTPTGDYLPPLPLRFRGSTECTSSECYLIAIDMHFWNTPHRPKIYVNPQVKVAYDTLNFLFHTRLEHLMLSKPWRLVWQDWIGHRMFGWLSDWIWLKEDRCSGKRGSEVFVEADYCR